MLDFRYHALSLVAVFLALGIGIVLGATLGDQVVSQANRDVRSSLRGDLIEARDDARAADARVAQRDRFDSAAFPYIAGGKLRGKRVAIVSSGALPQDVEIGFGCSEAPATHARLASSRTREQRRGRCRRRSANCADARPYYRRP